MSAEQIRIREARPGDCTLLPAIERAAAAQFRTTPYPEMADASLASEELDLARAHVWVAVDDADAPVAFAIVHVLDGAAHVHELDVHPAYARRGVGRRLLEVVAAWARERGMSALTLTTFADVAWNGPYYQRLGFRAIAATSLGAALRAVQAAEARAGLPVRSRICMQLDLPAGLRGGR